MHPCFLIHVLQPESGQESMPRNINLPLTERKALQDYFNNLANISVK
jgi:hypothetical protein